MFDFFDILLGYVRFFFELVVGVVESTVTAVSLILTSLSLPQFLVGYLPGILGTAVMITTAVAVVRFIANK